MSVYRTIGPLVSYVSEILLMLAQYLGNDVLIFENKQNYFIIYNVGPMLTQRCKKKRNNSKICIFV